MRVQEKNPRKQRYTGRIAEKQLDFVQISDILIEEYTDRRKWNGKSGK